MAELSGKTVIITGASLGIWRALALEAGRHQGQLSLERQDPGAPGRGGRGRPKKLRPTPAIGPEKGHPD